MCNEFMRRNEMHELIGAECKYFFRQHGSESLIIPDDGDNEKFSTALD